MLKDLLKFKATSVPATDFGTAALASAGCPGFSGLLGSALLGLAR